MDNQIELYATYTLILSKLLPNVATGLKLTPIIMQTMLVQATVAKNSHLVL